MSGDSKARGGRRATDDAQQESPAEPRGDLEDGSDVLGPYDDVKTARALIGGWFVQQHADGGLIVTTPEGHECALVESDYGHVAFMDKNPNDERPWVFEIVTDESGLTAGAVTHHGSNVMLMQLQPHTAVFSRPIPDEAYIPEDEQS